MKRLLIICFVLTASMLKAQALPEYEIAINSLIKGTFLQAPQNDAPLAIIIPGSGPTDRNGNQQMMQNNSLKKLAHALAQNGISTFRYDKRIFTMLKAGDFKEEDIRFDNFVSDAISVITYFKEKGVQNISLIGHSQGALVAMLAAKQEPVQKLISLEGPGQPIDQIILDQLEKEAPGLRQNAADAFNDLKETGKAEKFSIGLMSLLRPSIQPFMLSWMKYDPAQVISELSIPVFVITGSKDLQVPEGEGILLKKANPNVKLLDIQNMNHVLKLVDGDDLENSKSYNEPSRAIAPQLVEAIADFINNK